MFEGMRRYGKEFARAAGFAGIAAGTLGAVNQESEPQPQKDIEYHESGSEQSLERETREGFIPTDLDVHTVLLSKQADGSYELNPQVSTSDLLWNPIALRIDQQSTEVNTQHLWIPDIYARTFNEFQFSDNKDASLVFDAVQEASRDGARNAVFDFFVTKQAAEKIATEAPLPGTASEIVSINCTGIASPEAGDPNSVVPGYTDTANLELASGRALHACAEMAKEFERQTGIKIPEEQIRIFGEEGQFTQKEFQTLAEIGYEEGFVGDPATVAWRAVDAKEKGLLKIPDSYDRIGGIVDKYRGVNIEIVSKNQTTNQTEVPTPWFLLLPLISFVVREGNPPREKRSGNQPGTPSGEKSTGQTSTSGRGAETRSSSTKTLAPGLGVKETIRPSGIDTLVPDYTNIAPDTMDAIEEIGPNVIRGIEQRFDLYKGTVDRLNGTKGTMEAISLDRLTQDILKNWTDTDNKIRSTVGLPPLNHLENPHQIMYARLHAIAVTELAKAKAEADAEATKANQEPTALHLVWMQIRDRVNQILQTEATRLSQGKSVKPPTRTRGSQPSIIIGGER
jgi:hypothetical protein